MGNQKTTKTCGVAKKSKSDSGKNQIQNSKSLTC